MINVDSISIQRKNEFGKVKFSTNNFSLTIDRGEIISFVGASGSGKTTIAEILSGFLEPSSGKVECDEKKIIQPETQISLVLQDYRNAVFPWLTVKDNLELGYYKPTHKVRQNDKLSTIIDLLGIKEKQLSEYPNKLSGGQIQKIQIGRALIAGSDFLILDEPTSSLDMKFREELLQILIELKRKNIGILLITHHIDEAVFIGSKIFMSKEIDNHKYEISSISGYNHKKQNISEAQNDEEYRGLFQCVYNTIFGK